MKLSVPQSKIVKSPVGNAIQVLASAGSGKTRVLTARIRYILENTAKQGVIALTFTNKAAEEMKDRLSGIDNLEDRVWIGTVHSVAQRVLSQYGNTIGLPNDLHIFEQEQSKKTILMESLRASNIDIDDFFKVDSRSRDSEKSRDAVIQRYLSQFAYVKRELLTESEVKEKYNYEASFWSVYNEYQQALLNSGGIDFDDILVFAHRILLEQPWCGDIYRAKFRHIFVDEAQDLNRAQYEFVKVLAGDKLQSVLMVGDPNQMIYGFNGSSVKYLCENFIRDFSPTKFVLNENYRSSKSVIRIANKLKPNSQVEAEFALEGLCKFGDNLENEAAEANWILERIENLLAQGQHDEIEGAITLENMVVIGRSRFVFSALEKLLTEKSIPFSLKKGERRVEPESIFGKVLDLGVKVHINSKDWVDGRKLLSIFNLSSSEKWDDRDVLPNLSRSAKTADVFFPDLQSDLLSAISLLDLEKPNIPKFCAQFRQRIETISKNSSQDLQNELERTLVELGEFENCWTVFRKKNLGESLAAFRNALALGQLLEYQSQKGLLLSTVHTMKGLEKDIVFLLGMCDGIFPDYRAKTIEDIEEEKNSAFVAVTRSRRFLYISYPKIRSMPWGEDKIQRPSAFLKTMMQ